MFYLSLFNAVEAVLWGTIASMIAVRGSRVCGMTSRLQWLLTVSFAAFGVSDLIEIRTGAWWEPPSLLVFKGICLSGIVIGALRLWRNQAATPGRMRRSTEQTVEPSGDDDGGEAPSR